MSILSDNMRFLRGKQKLSQQKVADELKITRGRYAKYEDGSSEPPIEILQRISKFFHVSIDLMVGVDVRKYPLDQMMNLPDNRILLPIMVDAAGNDRIEIVPQKASMGYLSGYTDPSYIENLESISLPFLTQGKYRAFPAMGDSMPPFKDGTYIVAKYVEGIENLRKNKTYIFITQNEGIVYKRYTGKTENALQIKSDNTFYAAYDLPLEQLVEVWEFACSISMEEFEAEENNSQNIKDMLLELRKDVRRVEEKIGG